MRSTLCAGVAGPSGQTLHAPARVASRNRDRPWWRVRRGIYRTVLIYCAL